jgi:hypoxanthine phosphoribosyltransferase
VQSCVSALPIESGEYVVTTIPATEGKQNKLAWKLARFISRTNNIPFVGVTLSREKPEMKTLPLEDKIKVWRDIYSDNDWVIVPSDLYGKKVLIVDDLFQSGASIFCFAEFLKNSLDVKEVSAVASVKAQKDGDNA